MKSDPFLPEFGIPFAHTRNDTFSEILDEHGMEDASCPRHDIGHFHLIQTHISGQQILGDNFSLCHRYH